PSTAGWWARHARRLPRAALPRSARSALPAGEQRFKIPVSGKPGSVSPRTRRGKINLMLNPGAHATRLAFIEDIHAFRIALICPGTRWQGSRQPGVPLGPAADDVPADHHPRLPVPVAAHETTATPAATAALQPQEERRSRHLQRYLR